MKTGYVFPACLGEKPSICSKHFAFGSPLPILIVSSSGAWLCNNMYFINSSYIRAVGTDTIDASKILSVLPLLPFILLTCCFAPAQSPLDCFPCQHGWVAGCCLAFHGQAALQRGTFQCLLRTRVETFFCRGLLTMGKRCPEAT